MSPKKTLEKKPQRNLLKDFCKGLDTMDVYFKRKRADKEFENGQSKDSPYKIKD